jgi:hypothetical protein
LVATLRRAALAALVVVGQAAAGCGGGGATSTMTSAPTTPAPPPGTTSTQEAPPMPAGLAPGLAIGLNETNASLVRAPGTSPDVPEFRPWQERVAALKPALYRLPIDWAALQPDPSKPANLAIPADGCMRGQGPCAPFDGIRGQLAAAASEQRAGNGFEVVVVFFGVPDWAARPAHGCERPGIQPRSRPITDQGLTQFRALVRGVASLARELDADIRWWSPWNEPNGAFFISPQRAQCSTAGPSLSPGVYARLWDAVKAELDAVPGDQGMVLGDLAGVARGTKRGTGSGEFVRGLPEHVVCQAQVVAQHAYADLPGQKKQPGDPVKSTENALAAHACARDTPIWITETGVGGLHAGDERRTGAASLRAQCTTYDAQLGAWRKDPRIRAAFQYTFREDPAFPVGLADAGLTRTYPTYGMLKAWAGRANPDDPPPQLPAECRQR